MGSRSFVRVARVVAPAVGVPLERRMRKQEKQAKTAQARVAQLEAEESKRQAEVEAASDEAKRRARRRTIFAGADIERNIFRRTLGGGSGAQTTLG